MLLRTQEHIYNINANQLCEQVICTKNFAIINKVLTSLLIFITISLVFSSVKCSLSY